MPLRVFFFDKFQHEIHCLSPAHVFIGKRKQNTISVPEHSNAGTYGQTQMLAVMDF